MSSDLSSLDLTSTFHDACSSAPPSTAGEGTGRYRSGPSHHGVQGSGSE